MTVRAQTTQINLIQDAVSTAERWLAGIELSVPNTSSLSNKPQKDKKQIYLSYQI